MQGLRALQPSGAEGAQPGPACGGKVGLGCCSGLFLFHDCNCTKWSRSGALPPSPGPPGNLRHSHRFPHVTWGRLRRPASLLLPCPAAPRWLPGPGSGAWESRSQGGEGKGGRARSLGSWGSPRERGPWRGGKNGGGPERQRPGDWLPERLGGLVAAAGSYSTRPLAAPPPSTHTHSHTFPFRQEAEPQEARPSLAWAGRRLQLLIHGEASSRLAPPPGCALYQG